MVRNTIILLLLSAGLYGADKPRDRQARVSKEVHHELVMLPYYGVFDDLSYRVDSSTVMLFSAVTRPTLKSDAENVVKKIEGVGRVVNEIEVLPLSPNDDQLRRAIYRAIYSSEGLDRYGLAAVPSIHMAGIRANGVPGAFSVKNNLVVTKD